MTPATIRDVAKQAGVSVATVSRVLNKSFTVREGTSQKVLAVIEELDYSPSPTARRLSIGRTHTVGVIIPFLTLPSFVERLRGVESALAESEYDLVLFSADTPTKVDHYFSELSRRDRADGVIIISLHPDEIYVTRFRKSAMPAVLLDAQHPDISSIVVDDVAGGYKATRHLIELGHTRIAYLSDYLDNPFKFVAMRHRFQGYHQALEEASISYRPEYQKQGELGGREAVAIAKQMLVEPDRPTAIFAASDIHAVGVLKAAQELNIRVPQDLSVIGFDGIRDSEHLDITTVCQPLFDSGVVSVNTLLSAINEPSDIPEKIVLPTKLIVRGTTVPPRG
jgi:DNA-binding LacI/PurR family transcriptional regulator